MLAREDETTQELLQTWAGTEAKGRAGGVKATAAGARAVAKSDAGSTPPTWPGMPSADLAELIQDLTDQMKNAAAELQFEVAARLRDEISRAQEGAPPDDGGDEVSEQRRPRNEVGRLRRARSCGSERALATK